VSLQRLRMRVAELLRGSFASFRRARKRSSIGRLSSFAISFSAARLADFIEQIRLDFGDPRLKVDIIAHSMGGLIARYYIRYGRADVLDDNDFPVNMYGGDRVRRVVLLGTPSLGSVEIPSPGWESPEERLA